MKRYLFFLLLLMAGVVIGVQPSAAADVVVGDGTAASCTQTAFDNALATAQNSGGTITFNCNVATISFTQQKLITGNVIIDGAGLITLSGNNATRLFRVQSSRSLTLRNIILTNGNAGSDYGGAIYVENNAFLMLEGATVQNSAANQAGGAIIDFNGYVSITNSVIANNQSTYGAINSTGIVEIINSVIMSNTATVAGGALSVGGDVTIIDSRIHHNSAPNGGAMLLTSTADVSITNSTFLQNEANGATPASTGGGAILTDGTLTIQGSTFDGNVSAGSGGAIQSGYLTSAAQTFILQTAIVGNEAVLYGGGIYNKGSNFQLINSTLSANSTQGSGGGLTSFLGPATLIYVTAANNVGGNLSQRIDPGNNDNRQRIYLTHTAVAGGASNCLISGGLVDPQPYFISQNNNLSSDNTCATYLIQANDSNNTPAQLAPLADNGGTTLSHLPQAGSPLLDTAVCQPDFFIDQRGVTRPQNGLCDIGAVEISSSHTEPTPTPLPTATATPSPTPQSTPPVPAAGASFPFNPIQITNGIRPTINLNISHAYGGQTIGVSGTGGAGYSRVRIFSVERGKTVGAMETAVSNNNYQANLIIPYTMPVGTTKICAAPVGLTNGELACQPFTVDPMPAGSIDGQIQSSGFANWNAQVNLVDTRGRLLQTTPVNSNGGFQFSNVYPGVYQYFIGGSTTKPINGGEIIIEPATNLGINPLEGLEICIPSQHSSSYLRLDRGATNSSSDKYAGVVLAESHPFLDGGLSGIELDWGKFQKERFGFYISGVHRVEQFVAIPQVNGIVQQVVFNLRNVDGSLADTHTETVAPYTVGFNMGLLQPSNTQGDPYIEVIPYVNGSAECPSTFLVQVLEDPMAADVFRGDSATIWNAAANVYTFNGVVPDIPGLPVDFSIPSEPLPRVGQFTNKIDAGIYLTGFLTEDGVVRVQTISAQALLTLLSIPLVDSQTIEQRELPSADRALEQLKTISFSIPKEGDPLIQLIEPIELGIPFVETPIFSLFGIDFVAGTSAKVGFDATLHGEVWPFAPAASVTLTPSGFAEAEVTIGTGLGGVMSVGAGLGFHIDVDVPVTIAFPPANAQVEVCPSLTMFAHVYARFMWVRKDHYENLFPPLTGCFDPLREATVPLTPTLSLDVLAAPAVATSPDGQVLSAFVQDTAVSGPPQLQIMARFQDGNGQWQTAVSVSSPDHSTGTPQVAFAGANNLPLIVWAAQPYDSTIGDNLPDDFNAHLSRQELFASWYEGGSWQPPIRLTNDLFADGMPSLVGNSSGALLAWVRDGDGDPLTRADQRIAVAEFDIVNREFPLPPTLLTGGATGLNAEPQTAYVGNQPYVVWTYDGDATLETAVDRRIAIAQKTGDDWLVDLPPNLPPAVDSPAIVGGQTEATIAFLVREPDEAGGIGFLGMNGQLWTARRGDGSWHATPLRDDSGAFVYAERPLLATNQNETVLAFRQFGSVNSNAKLGQISMSTAQGTGAFSSPIYLTDEAMQFWQIGLAINPVTNKVVLVNVERPEGNSPPNRRPDAVRTPLRVMNSTAAPLSMTDDPVTSITVIPTGDPALDPLQLSGDSVAAGATVTVTAVLRNIGRNPVNTITVTLYSGTPANRTLLGTQMVNGPLLFNGQRAVVFAITAVAGEQDIFAELTTGGENSLTSNDRAFAKLGELTAPAMHEIILSDFTPNALDISWYPAVHEHVNSYRILRSPSADGNFEFIGESTATSFTDTLVIAGETYCYQVQSYNGAFNLSPISDVRCGTVATVDGYQVYLPVVIR